MSQTFTTSQFCIPNDWEKILALNTNQSFQNFLTELLLLYHVNTIYPKFHQVFNAFQLTPFEDVKVVILGQDPYHGEGEANGLCFSVNEGVKIPPSLKNIFNELNTDISKEIPKHGDLSHWAKQGILLLNSSLTVEKGKANSHATIGWQIFTDEVIKLISNHKSGVVFLLWGKFAASKEDLIDQSKHFKLTSSHPSPLGAYKGFIGCKHFSKTNEILESNNQEKINW